MSVDLPNSSTIFIPQIPRHLENAPQAQYLKDLRRSIENVYVKLFDNIDHLRSYLHTGTTGTFKASNGDTITVATGIITGLS